MAFLQVPSWRNSGTASPEQKYLQPIFGSLVNALVRAASDGSLDRSLLKMDAFV